MREVKMRIDDTTRFLFGVYLGKEIFLVPIK